MCVLVYVCLCVCLAVACLKQNCASCSFELSSLSVSFEIDPSVLYKAEHGIDLSVPLSPSLPLSLSLSHSVSLSQEGSLAVYFYSLL